MCNIARVYYRVLELHKIECIYIKFFYCILTMKLRSGKIKPSVPLCKCGKYWGSINHKNMCSMCYNHGSNYKQSFKK